jgi:hypothetical protein
MRCSSFGMACKQAVMKHKALSDPGVGFPLKDLIARFKSAVKFNIPVTYQDGGGFLQRRQTGRKASKVARDVVE